MPASVLPYQSHFVAESNRGLTAAAVLRYLGDHLPEVLVRVRCDEAAARSIQIYANVLLRVV